jgi:hypothetical protein
LISTALVVWNIVVGIILIRGILGGSELRCFCLRLLVPSLFDFGFNLLLVGVFLLVLGRFAAL